MSTFQLQGFPSTRLTSDLPSHRPPGAAPVQPPAAWAPAEPMHARQSPLPPTPHPHQAPISRYSLFWLSFQTPHRLATSGSSWPLCSLTQEGAPRQVGAGFRLKRSFAWLPSLSWVLWGSLQHLSPSSPTSSGHPVWLMLRVRRLLPIHLTRSIHSPFPQLKSCEGGGVGGGAIPSTAPCFSSSTSSLVPHYSTAASRPAHPVPRARNTLPCVSCGPLPGRPSCPQGTSP